MNEEEHAELFDILTDLETLRLELFEADEMDCQFASDAEKLARRLRTLISER